MEKSTSAAVKSRRFAEQRSEYAEYQPFVERLEKEGFSLRDIMAEIGSTSSTYSTWKARGSAPRYFYYALQGMVGTFCSNDPAAKPEQPQLTVELLKRFMRLALDSNDNETVVLLSRYLLSLEE